MAEDRDGVRTVRHHDCAYGLLQNGRPYPYGVPRLEGWHWGPDWRRTTGELGGADGETHTHPVDPGPWPQLCGSLPFPQRLHAWTILDIIEHSWPVGEGSVVGDNTAMVAIKLCAAIHNRAFRWRSSNRAWEVASDLVDRTGCDGSHSGRWDE